MRIEGEWLVCGDGAVCPVIYANVIGDIGRLIGERFLIDTGADRSVLSAATLGRLRLPVRPAASDMSLVGIGGAPEFVLLTTVVEFTHETGVARVGGELAAFTDPRVADMSVLGRDVLDVFDVILSRRRNEVLLLAPRHRYLVMSD
jgi:hypothetical protein